MLRRFATTLPLLTLLAATGLRLGSWALGYQCAAERKRIKAHTKGRPNQQPILPLPLPPNHPKLTKPPCVSPPSSPSSPRSPSAPPRRTATPLTATAASPAARPAAPRAAPTAAAPTGTARRRPSNGEAQLEDDVVEGSAAFGFTCCPPKI
ncbi:hypothetical protein MIND_00383600 [Mycena indigotica]|uniref:Uncharacterized protein n=1 Tax=Mycena indigotica TaxID=2126181 RepID=A0A8H6T340_9AGAR|nr:uncharacterized protein MIND_00383600 [Mycena indigotica]KAF7310103.1 hypothetical protein MIND_00383600 [Mycena indigotica]